MLLEEVTDEAPYLARSARVERIAQRYKLIPVRFADSDDQLAVFQVFLLRFLFVGHCSGSFGYAHCYALI